MRQLLLYMIFAAFVWGETTHLPIPLADKNDTRILSAQKRDEKLRLMFQVFTYSSDLKNAYVVGQKALKYFPDSLYWHQKMAEVSQWIDKPNEAIRHYEFIYKKTHDLKLRKKILDYSLAAYQYETAAPILKEIALSNPSEKNLDKLVDIYNKTGSPEEAAKILENLSMKNDFNETLAAKALKIYMEMGEASSASRLVERIEKEKSYNIYTATALGDYYLSQKNSMAAYRSMQKVKKSSLGGNTLSYYRWMSDMGWYLQKFKVAAEASRKLYERGEAQPQDYERILFYYKDKESAFVGRVAYAAYRKFGKKYLYTGYLDTLSQLKQYHRLVTEIEKGFRGPMGKDLKSEVYIWLMLGGAYGAEKEYTKSIEAYRQALRLDPSSAEIEAAILWSYIDHKQYAAMKAMMWEIEKRRTIPPVLKLPLAVGNFVMQRSDRAMLYVKELMKYNRKSIDLKFMYADLMQTREETGAFMKMMEKIYTILDAQRKREPSRMHHAAFVENYLKSAMYFMPVDQFERVLHRSKSLLSTKRYREITIFQTLRHRAQERAEYLSRKLKQVEPWMQLNVALFEDARADQQTILYRYYTILPIRDRVTAAVRTGNIAFAQTLLFKGLEENRRDYLLYQQMRDLDEKYANTVHLKGGLQRRTELDRKYLDISGHYYLHEAWRFFARAATVQNSMRKAQIFKKLPRNETLFKMGIEKRFTRGIFSLEAGVRAAMKTYGFAKAKLHYDIISRIFIEAECSNSHIADETTYLLLGGKKDELKVKTSFQYLPSTSVALKVSGQHFYSQDNYSLGKGYRIGMEWYHQIRHGYPDLAWSLFSEYGNYKEEEGKRGVIDDLPYLSTTQVLPETYYTVGTTFYYGMANKQNYTRVWRPYVSFSPYFNGLNNQFDFSLDAGVGGLLYDRDHLNFGLSYDQSVNGTDESSSRIYFHYKHFFEAL